MNAHPRRMLIPLLLGILLARRAHGAAAGGDIVATDGTLMFRVDAATGMRSVLSDFSNAAQGPTGASFSVAATAAGAVYVTDNAPDDQGKLFQVFADGTRIRSVGSGPRGAIRTAEALGGHCGRPVPMKVLPDGG